MQTVITKQWCPWASVTYPSASVPSLSFIHGPKRIKQNWADKATCVIGTRANVHEAKQKLLRGSFIIWLLPSSCPPLYTGPKPEVLCLIHTAYAGERRSKRARRGEAEVKVSSSNTLWDFKLRLVEALNIHPKNADVHIRLGNTWQKLTQDEASLAGEDSSCCSDHLSVFECEVVAEVARLACHFNHVGWDCFRWEIPVCIFYLGLRERQP